MNSKQLLFPLFSLFILSLLSGQGLGSHQRHFSGTSKKLFVFGDSYVDTGNFYSPDYNLLTFPYGITYPGKPDGRFSDGLVLTDFIAKFLGVSSPTPYRRLEKTGFRAEDSKSGVNFAYGGSGVFDTFLPYLLPNMTTQIDYFQNLIANSSLTTGKDNSIALVSVSGNDYAYYLGTNGKILGFPSLIFSIVNQIRDNLKRIESLGVKKIVVTALGPLGCVPQITNIISFKRCLATVNLLVDLHNYLLKEAVAKLNKETKDSPFVILDLHTAFLSIIENKGNGKFKTPLKPCCHGISQGNLCGAVDKEGKKMYELCKDPKSSFYWDELHPTQEGWKAALSTLDLTVIN